MDRTYSLDPGQGQFVANNLCFHVHLSLFFILPFFVIFYMLDYLSYATTHLVVMGVAT